jgi:5-formyltetrahydrofolate cyclo-ligase
MPREEKTVADDMICSRLSGLAVSPVAVYLASSDEVDIDSLVCDMLSSGAVVVAPRWNGVRYELARLSGLDADNLRIGPMGIREPLPSAETVSPGEIRTWLVPGLAFTRDGRRLGYGGGWYDRLMAEAAKDAVKIGVAYSFQLQESLPCESHDVLLTEVVCEI